MSIQGRSRLESETQYPLEGQHQTITIFLNLKGGYMSLDIDRFIELSGAVKLDDIDWSKSAEAGLTDEEAQIVRYMADTETHTIIYMRDLLAGHSTKDPEITAFLSVWVYEELWHGRALDRVLVSAGRDVSGNRATEVIEGITWRERFEAFLSSIIANSTPHFIATHMAWGALNELTAAASYQALARRTNNPVLREVCKRIARQERKHFAFYYEQATWRLKQSRLARFIARIALNYFWTPVGSGLLSEEQLPMISEYLFGDEDGKAELERIQCKMNQLAGLEDFTEVTEQIGDLISRQKLIYAQV